MKSNELFFELIRVSLGILEKLSHIPTKQEWLRLYTFCKTHAIIGVCFRGVQRLYQKYGEQTSCLPNELRMQWLAMAASIQSRNAKMDSLTVEMWKRLHQAGLESAVLKGQGIACLYTSDLCSLRQSGDIDIWVRGGFDVVNDFVQKTIPTDDFAYHRFHYNAFSETEVELHHRPTLMRNLLDNRRLQNWCNSFSESSFVLLKKGFYVPSLEFNRVFILTHIYRHFLFEGIGMRQVMDYYFVLKSKELDAFEKEQTMALFKQFRMTRFVAAMMWIMQEVFGLESKYLLYKANQEEGKFVLSEIMQTGNFGHGENRYVGYSKLKRMTRHGLHLFIHYPSEVIWTPIWLIYHKIWRAKKMPKVLECIKKTKSR